MPTIEEALNYLGIDYPDDMVTANVTRALATAGQVVHGSIGDDVDVYLPDDPRVKELTLIYLDDLYSQRGVAAKVSGAVRRLVADMELQLRLELARVKAGVAEEVTKPRNELLLVDEQTGHTHSLRVVNGDLTMSDTEGADA